MARVKGGARAHARHKKVIKQAKGYYGRRKNCFRTAVQAVEKAGQYAYRDRRAKKREFRRLWIQRINAAARIHDMTYSTFMHGLKLAGIELDRKSLSEIAIADEKGFAAIAKQAQDALAKAA
ncbi:MAG: 50S ribosomal protein L20 [Micavibrio sp. TMED27]|mgnify:CR=1 FL=1|nr:50S ribosomal protein L20 [Micavibrio sp.]OUT90439.1 MAG: 50S ribosomal protein L20 [Micavibrio sp. TMED27]|tara:strand:+ start:608 stop:973 length:366 start_codon:yes stop_codon:yes gene_type:complete